MEYLDGETLKARLARGSLTEPETIEIALSVSAALESAHARDLVHCDIKPVNIFLTRLGGTKVLDFGIAKLGSTNRRVFTGRDAESDGGSAQPGAGSTEYARAKTKRKHANKTMKRFSLNSLNEIRRTKSR